LYEVAENIDVAVKVEHSFADVYLHDAEGHWKECVCGEKTSASEHNFSGWVITVEPTETADGEREKNCTDCGYTVTEPVKYHQGPSGTCGSNLTWVIEDGVLTISGTGQMSYSGNVPWYDYRNQITELVMEEGITYVAYDAFAGCRNLKKVSLPQSAKRYGEHVFEYCTSLTEVTVPEGTWYIEEGAFYGCTNLQTIVLPESLSDIPNAFCYNCSNLKTVTIKNGLAYIEESAFEDCISLNQIVIPGSVEYIGEDAFRGCKSLKTVVLEEGISEVHDAAFANCTPTYMLLPKSLTYLDYNALGVPTIIGFAGSKEEWTVLEYTTSAATTVKFGVTSLDQIAHDWKHVKNAAGLLKNGSEYDLCTICGQKKNVKTLAGYATYYVKSFKVSKGKKSFTAKWSKQSATNQKKFNGYQIRYSLKSNMAGAKMVTAAKSSKSKKISKLKKKTTYYVQVRTFTKYGGKTFYSKWSPKKSVKTK